MIKKYRLLVLVLLILLCFLAYKVYKRTVTFVYTNPYTQTAGFEYIAPTIKELNKAFDYAKDSSKMEGNGFSYIFKNAYGSGFLNNNPIPNDLDFAVGVYLGEYDYNGENAKEIAESVVNKMDAFQFYLNFYVNSFRMAGLYTDKSQFDLLSSVSIKRRANIEAISSSIPKVVLGEDYVKYTLKGIRGADDNEKIELPYILKSNEILIENYDPINLYSDLVAYNQEMPHYIRGISVIPEFFVKIKSKNSSVMVEIVPEAFLGERLQLSRRFFASGVFTDFISRKFLKNLKYLNNDEEYFYYRMFSYRRHLQEIYSMQAVKARPVKMLKRIMQTADIISPVLSDEEYNEISAVINKNLSNRDIQLLNEYNNICNNLFVIQESPELFLRLYNDRKLKVMYDTMSEALDELEVRGNVDKALIKKLRDFLVKDIQKMFVLRTPEEVVMFRRYIFSEKYGDITDTINSAIYSQMEDVNRINSSVKLYNDIYAKAGYHKVMIGWIDGNTMGILKDDFTKNIDDLQKFSKENDLVAVNYKFVNEAEYSKIAIKYALWARYNSSVEENANFEYLKSALINDRKNFKIKQKTIFIH